ncbi:DUF1648 domain-containing protein [Sporosarcina sp. A2]|uniref:DUF1648 domain-containing protein n=1 Tax=Sporosarcina sp. A2 TaxID=3393449 RepID=UPI003D7B1BC1
MKKFSIPIETHKTTIHRIFDALSISALVAVSTYTIISWKAMPEEVPIHLNGLGEVDNYGSKWTLLLLLFISIGLFAFLEFLERHPEWHNYPSRLNETNALQFYQTSRSLLNQVKAISVFMMVYIQWKIVWIALGKSSALSMWILGGLLTWMTAIIIIGVLQQRKIK